MDLKALRDLPTLTRYLLLINIALFVLSYLLPDLQQTLALHYFESTFFQPHQIITHFFMHSGFTHILFNMYALVIFGSVLERQLGTQRFGILYFFAAVGAFMLHMGIIWFELRDVPLDVLNQLQTEGAAAVAKGMNFKDEYLGGLNAKYNGAVVGASGAIMGLLLGFAMIFPNAELQLIFIPIPLKAKYFMPIYMILELVLGVGDFQWDNVAHFAHLGGAIVGAVFLYVWIKKGVVQVHRHLY